MKDLKKEFIHRMVRIIIAIPLAYALHPYLGSYLENSEEAFILWSWPSIVVLGIIIFVLIRLLRYFINHFLKKEFDQEDKLIDTVTNIFTIVIFVLVTIHLQNSFSITYAILILIALEFLGGIFSVYDEYSETDESEPDEEA